jgi:hypothetical protein
VSRCSLIKVARAGTLDNMDWAEPVANIWTESKAAWVKINPELVNFSKGAVDRTPLFDAWTRHNQWSMLVRYWPKADIRFCTAHVCF